MTRERTVQERRAKKQEKREERKAAAAAERNALLTGESTPSPEPVD